MPDIVPNRVRNYFPMKADTKAATTCMLCYNITYVYPLIDYNSIFTEMPRLSADLSVPCQLLGELANLTIVVLKLSTFANPKATLVASASNGMEVLSAVIMALRNECPNRAPFTNCRPAAFRRC
ncbi:MAG: hypothetical protein ACI80I_002866 [Akkermansiaceae bacterium]|jgi:hypothetical protein